MKNLYLHLIKLSLLGLLALHLSMHVLYLAPANPAAFQYSNFVNKYMSSFFTQNWHLFAPEPATSSLQLSYRCNEVQSWQYPLEVLSKDHKAFPFTAKGKQTYVLQHLAREIFNGKIKNKNESEMTELQVLQRYLQDQCGRYAAAEVQIKRVYTPDYSKRFTNQQGKTEIYEFSIQRNSLVWN